MVFHLLLWMRAAAFLCSSSCKRGCHLAQGVACAWKNGFFSAEQLQERGYGVFQVAAEQMTNDSTLSFR